MFNYRTILVAVIAVLIFGFFAALIVGGIIEKQPCIDAPPYHRYNLCFNGSELKPVMGIGWTCVCPGSKLETK